MGNNQKTLILIDGHALAYRSYFALERTGMHTSDGQPSWAVYGFFKALFDLLKKVEPDALAVSFDMGRKTFRTEAFSEYKANRESMPDSMRSQMQFLHEGLEAMDIPIYQLENYEADDVIGTIAYKAKKAGHKTLILTGDKDSFQLVDKEGYIKVLIPSKGQLDEYDWEKVYERMGVYPDQVVDYKGLCGDTSDNIPGVKGIGDKTAVKLLSEYQTLDNVFENVENISAKALKRKLIEGVDIAKKSQFLATIDLDSPIDFDFEHTHLSVLNINKVSEFFKKMQFFSLLKQIPSLHVHFNGEPEVAKDIELQPNESNQEGQLSLFGAASVEEKLPVKEFVPASSGHQKIITSRDDFDFLLEELKAVSVFSLDTETTGLDTLVADLVGISISYDKNFSYNGAFSHSGESTVCNYYIPVGHKAEGEKLVQLDLGFVLDFLKLIFEDENKAKVLQNAKYEINILKRYGIDLKGVVLDTMLASYIKDPAYKHGLKQQALSYLGLEMQPIDELIGKGRNQITMDMVPIEKAAPYACDDSFATLELAKMYALEFDEKQWDLMNNIELPLVNVLAYMERTGVHIDTAYLAELSSEIEGNLAVIEAKIYALAGEIFNINSPAQVGVILFDKLGLPSGKKTKTGYSTNAKILENLAKDYEIAKLLLEQRHFAKIKSTYVDALPELISIVDGRIHTSFNQTVTTTGRLSSSNPNLQNIPIRTEIGNRIRAAFTAQDDDSVILAADYSQIELRLLAHFSGDEKLIDAFVNGVDIHIVTASSVFDVPVGEVTKDMRRKAKAVNFGIIYGQTSFGLSNTIDVSPGEAKTFIDKYFATYPKIKEYLDGTVSLAHKQGYVETMYGRRRNMADELASRNRMIREFAERAATNTPLQGTAADLMKLAMIKTYQMLMASDLKAKLVIQVHDELVIEVPKDEIQAVSALVKEAMELDQPLNVPLEIDIQVGQSWMESEEVEVV